MGYVKQHLEDIMYEAAAQIYLDHNADNLNQCEIEDLLWDLWEVYDPMIENSEEMILFYKDHYHG